MPRRLTEAAYNGTYNCALVASAVLGYDVDEFGGTTWIRC